MKTSINRLTIGGVQLVWRARSRYRRHELHIFCARFDGRIVRRCNVLIGICCLDPSRVVAHNVTVRETAQSINFTENFVTLRGLQTNLLN
jgi:hypothetical protein